MKIEDFVPDDEKTLDVGCGNRKIGDVGIDKDPGSDADVIQDVEKGLPFESEEFGCVVSRHLLEHLSDAQGLLNEVHRILKPDGRLVLETEKPYPKASSFWDDPTHVRPYTKKSLRKLSKNAGFSEVKTYDWGIRGLSYCPTFLSKVLMNAGLGSSLLLVAVK
nr:hypothetical protein [uncultured archaeon]